MKYDDESKHYAIRNGQTFFITNSKEAVWQYLMRGHEDITVVDRYSSVIDVPLNKIVGKIGEDWYVKAENQEIR